MATITAWGSNGDNRVSGTPAGSDFAGLAPSGSRHMLAIRSGGSAAAWGAGEFGQVSGLPADAMAAVACGRDHAAGLTTAGGLRSWGRGDESGFNYGAASPPSGSGFVAVAAGDGWSAAIDGAGQVVAWGDIPPWTWADAEPGPYFREWRARVAGQSGVYGPPGATWGEYPLPSGSGFVAVAGRHWAGFAIDGSGGLHAFGYMPTAMAAVPAGPFVEVAVGGTYAVGRRPDGTLAAWGDTPAITSAVPAGGGHLSIAAGLSAAFAVRADGTIAAFGSNTHGELTGVPSGGGFAKVAAGSGTAYAL